jgi:tetratricopeptide (TPR) repeat protein
VSENKLQKKSPSSIKEKSQYFLAFGVVASMLLVAGFPVFVIFFFAVFAFFLFKMFASGTRNETRDIFEFYLAANEMLRDDGRSWFGFELKDSISRGEAILNRMSGAPPLVYFALGALYHKAGDHQGAINCLSHIIENENAAEAAYVYPSQELRNYVKVLRKIERDPGEAPLTSASIRALERARKLRGKTLLDESRAIFAKNSNVAELPESVPSAQPAVYSEVNHESQRRSVTDTMFETFERPAPPPRDPEKRTDTQKDAGSKRPRKDPFVDRKPITEVLHDIYDKNVQ